MNRADLELLDDQWLVKQLNNKTKRPRAETHEPLIDLDSERAIARAREYLVDAPAAVEGAGGDVTTYAVACRVREFGVSEPMCLELMGEWNDTRAHPPWDAEDLQAKVENAYQYATGAWGGASALAEFGVVETPRATVDRPKLYRVNFIDSAALALVQLAESLIDDVLDQEAMAVFYGASNSGKTYVVLDMAYHIATGRAWGGREVAQGPVLYIAAEGSRGVYKRFAALKQRYGDAKVMLDLVPCPVNLLSSKADIEAVMALVRDCEAEHGMPVRMIVVDTLSRALAGGDENTSVDMGGFVRNVDRIRSRVKCAVTIIHHTGKDAAKGARGWSGLRAATDTEIEIVESTIKVTKQRDMETIKDLRFALDSLEIGRNAKGKPVTACVVRLIAGSEFDREAMSPQARTMAEALDLVAKGQAEERGDPEKWQSEIVSTVDWEAEFMRLAKHSQSKMSRMSSKSGDRRFSWSARRTRELRQEAAEHGFAEKVAHNQWISKSGG